MGRPRPLRHFFVLLLAAFHQAASDEQEYRLARYLMTNYDPAVRPAENSSEPLKVVFGISLHHIIDVDEKNQILTTNCWLTQIWTDHHLKWNVSDFAGIRVIRVPYNRVWRPDIILYNKFIDGSVVGDCMRLQKETALSFQLFRYMVFASKGLCRLGLDPHLGNAWNKYADSQYNSAVINTNVIVSHTGEVVWLSHGIFRSSCDINVEHFPFDIQSCNMKWSSWTYDGYQLDLVKQTEEGDTSNYQANGEFDLVSFDAVKHIEFYSCCPEPYPDITYVIRIRRRPMFYVFNLILPCILINGIALLVFYVPSESGEKVTLGISALLSMTVFLMTIRESLPPTEKTPLISMYYGVSICLVSFASGLSVVTLNVYHRGVRGAGVPQLVKTLVLGKLARLVFLQFEPRDKFATASSNQQDVNPRTGTRLDCQRPPDKWGSEDTEHLDPQQMSPRFPPRRSHPETGPGPAQDSFEAQFLRMLNKVSHAIERSELRAAARERRDTAEVEWKQVALVCDRFLLWVFLLTTAITTAVILCGSPHGP